MRIVVLSFYYRPDLCAGSFRATALIKALLSKMPADTDIEVITTLPNRYSSFPGDAPELEKSPRLTIHRIKIPGHNSGMIDQSIAFIHYAYHAIRKANRIHCDLVFGTSSRLMTAVLSSFVAWKKRAPLYLDIRDIFVDTIGSVFPRKISVIVKPFFSMLERWSIGRADKVNLISKGFAPYFNRRYPKKAFSYFSNGIDAEFETPTISSPRSEKPSHGPITVLYVGNIGEGQELHSILPALAGKFEGRARFRVIGDGGRRKQLMEKLEEKRCGNVEMLPPMKRDRLLAEYQVADVLFLHLNGNKAFRKVLPSKIFEYAATGKPIWAGVAGYAASFIREEIENSAIFTPCSPEEAETAFRALKMESISRESFIGKYSRSGIMNAMAADILGLLRRA